MWLCCVDAPVPAHPRAAHLALGMMGMGMMWNPKAKEYQPAADVIAAHGLEALVLAPKVEKGGEGRGVVEEAGLGASCLCVC
jgi:hypothetical protein